MILCMHSYVSGRVQGVWFRDNTQRKANSLGLVGWVKNLPDGRVEVMACGNHAAIDVFQNWLWQGVPLSRVSSVEATEVECLDFTEFTIER